MSPFRASGETPLDLNPWAAPFAAASGALAEAANPAFRAARREAAIGRAKAGPETWDNWAGRMARLSLEAGFAALAEVEFRDATVAQDLVFAGCRFPGRFDASRAIVEGDAWMNGAIFEGPASFSGATFRRELQLAGARFMAQAAFDNARFEGTVEARQCRFAGVSFAQCVFAGDAWFAGSRFEDRAAGFDGARFEAEAGFGGCSFASARFAGADFMSNAGFERAAFEGPASFAGARFRKTAWFDRAAFGGEADFGRARFMGRMRFEGIALAPQLSPDAGLAAIVKRFNAGD